MDKFPPVWDKSGPGCVLHCSAGGGIGNESAPESCSRNYPLRNSAFFGTKSIRSGVARDERRPITTYPHNQMPVRPPVHSPLGPEAQRARALAREERAYREACRKREFDNRRRGHTAIYGNRWRKLRDAFLCRFPLCAQCDKPAEVVDHCQPHNGDLGMFYAWNNLQSLCKRCHDRKTAREDGGFGNQRRPLDQPVTPEPRRLYVGAV